MTCPHGFEKPSQCVDCMIDGPVTEPSKWSPVGGPFAAKFAANCSCGKPIAVGDRVQRWDYADDRTAYLHEGCQP